MTRFLTLVLVASFALGGCGKKKSPPPVPPAGGNASTPEKTPAPSAPKGVPASLKSRIESVWPKIESAGEEFVEKFKEAQAAQRSGERDKMQQAIEVARGKYEDALEMWNEIYYSVDDYEEDVAEACRRYMRTWNRKVDGWTKKAKALKEFSLAK